MLLFISATSGNNLRLCQRAKELADAQGIQTHLICLSSLDLPLFTTEKEASATPAALGELEEHFAKASALWISAPEYNGSIPPALVNAIAWLSRSSNNFRHLFNQKVVALSTHSGGGGQKVLVAMRMQLSHLGANVLGREILTNKSKMLRDESVQALLAQLQTKKE